MYNEEYKMTKGDTIMKKFFKFIFVLILVAVIGVGGFFVMKKYNIFPNSGDATTTTEAPTETTTTLYDRPMDATGEPITEEELKALYETANNMYIDWVAGIGLRVDWESVVTVDDVEYALVTTEGFSNVDQLKSSLNEYFSENIYLDLVEENFVTYEDKLYIRSDIVQGDETTCKGAKLTITSCTAEECEFSISLIYENTTYTRTYNYKLKAIDGKWKFVNSFDHSVSLSKQNHIKWN